MKRVFAVFFSFALGCAVATAQPGPRPGQGRPGGGGARPGTPGSSSLENVGIKVGQTLPDLTIFDDKGGEFRLADLKGKYSVIVFGCLT